MTHHEHIRRLEALLGDAWQRSGRRTHENKGELFGEHVIRYDADGGFEIEHISLTELAEDIAREMELF